MRAFESYGSTQYLLDSQTLWYELTAHVPQEVRDSLSAANIASDCFICSLYTFLGLGVVAFVIGGVYSRTSAFILGGASLVTALASNRRLLASTEEWKYAVQALVNLGRRPLAATLGLALPETLTQEREMWDAVTNHVAYRNTAWGELIDRFRLSPPISLTTSASVDTPGVKETDAASDQAD
jgi:hypothetical protein